MLWVLHWRSPFIGSVKTVAIIGMPFAESVNVSLSIVLILSPELGNMSDSIQDLYKIEIIERS